MLLDVQTITARSGTPAGPVRHGSGFAGIALTLVVVVGAAVIMRKARRLVE